MSLSVIIPSKNPRNLTVCLMGVRHLEPEAKLIVIDDGLPLEAILPLAVSGCTVIPGAKPFIFARNVNLGILKADRDDIIILNDDAILKTTGGFSRMQRAQQEHPEYGLIGAVTHHTGNPNQFPQGGRGLIPGLREDPRMVCFVCVYIPRTTIDRVGLLDEDFTGYAYEDDDYCLRVRQAGLKIGIHDGCFVDHGSLTSSFRGQPNAHCDMSANQQVFIRKHGSLRPDIRATAK